MAASDNRIRPLIRALCALFGVIGIIWGVYTIIIDIESALTWLHAIKYLVIGSACYVFLAVAVTGKIPDWLDI